MGSLSKDEKVKMLRSFIRGEGRDLDTSKIVIIHLPSPWRYARAALWCCNAASWLVCGEAPLYNDGSMVNNPT